MDMFKSEWHTHPSPYTLDGQYDDNWCNDKEPRVRTSRGALFACLNIGVDPPDMFRGQCPTAFMETWMDPLTGDPDQNLIDIGMALKQQYQLLQPRGKYYVEMDPTPGIVEEICRKARSAAGDAERVIFHFNGHGVPRATANGEIWVFNDEYTQYLPVAMFELVRWLKGPSVVVLDCNGAGHLLDWYKSYLRQCVDVNPVEIIFFVSCGAEQSLPWSPKLPADVFTACLTTPIRMALQWHLESRSMLQDERLAEIVDAMPGALEDRHSPIGELSWIFTSITDAIGFDCCDAQRFKKLFRDDTMVSYLCRNFFLADRLLQLDFDTTPEMFPQLPSQRHHALWDVWDLEVDRCLAKLLRMHQQQHQQQQQQQQQGRIVHYEPSTFFSDQLLAFEVWVARGRTAQRLRPPVQLSIILQALLSQSMRLRALRALSEFASLGCWAVSHILSVGTFPYLVKLLKSNSRSLREDMTNIWSKIVAVEPSVCAELLKKEAHLYFLQILASSSASVRQRSRSAFVLSVICGQGGNGRRMCLNAGLFSLASGCIEIGVEAGDWELRTWCAQVMGAGWRGYPDARQLGIEDGCHEPLLQLLQDEHPMVRASAVFAIGSLIAAGLGRSEQSHHQQNAPTYDPQQVDTKLIYALARMALDGAVKVRCELISAIQDVAFAYDRPLREQAALQLQQQVSESNTDGSSEMEHDEAPSNNTLPGALTRIWQCIRYLGEDPDRTCAVHAINLVTALVARLPSNLKVAAVRKRTDEQKTTIVGGSEPAPEDVSKFSWLRSPRKAAATQRSQPQPMTHSAAIERTSHSAAIPKMGRTRARQSKLEQEDDAISSSPSTSELNDGPEVKLPEKTISVEKWLRSRFFRADADLYENSINSVGGDDDDDDDDDDRPTSDAIARMAVSESQEAIVDYETLSLLSRSPVVQEYRTGGTFDTESTRLASSASSVVCAMFSSSSSSSNLLYTADEQCNVVAWRWRTGATVRAFRSKLPVARMEEVGVRGGRHLALASADCSFRVIEVNEQRRCRALAVFPSSLRGSTRCCGLFWHKSKGALMLCGDKGVAVWDAHSERLVDDWYPQFYQGKSATSMECSQDANCFYVGYESGMLCRFDSRNNRNEAVLKWWGHKVPLVGSCTFGKNSVVSCGADGHLLYWDVRSSESTRSARTQSGAISSFSFHERYGLLAFGSEADKQLEIRDLQGKSMSVIRYGDSGAYERLAARTCTAFHPTLPILASGGSDGVTSIFEP